MVWRTIEARQCDGPEVGCLIVIPRVGRATLEVPAHIPGAATARGTLALIFRMQGPSRIGANPSAAKPDTFFGSIPTVRVGAAERP